LTYGGREAVLVLGVRLEVALSDADFSSDLASISAGNLAYGGPLALTVVGVYSPGRISRGATWGVVKSFYR